MQWVKNLFVWILILGFMILAFNLFEGSKETVVKTPLNTVLQLADEGKLKEVKVKDNVLIGVTTDGQRIETGIPPGSDIVGKLIDKGVKVEVPAPEHSGWFVSFLVSWLPILFFIGIWIYMMRQVSGGGNPNSRAFSFGKSRAKVYIDEKPKITLNHVAGMEEVKEEVKEIIEYLKDPVKFQRLGGRPPKGVLFYGEPGVGKTLLAKAIAGEAHVPFISVSGSDFVEMFVGVGAARVRDLFDTAKRHAPCIIFIDEIDAVGRSRGAVNLGGGHDEREQTLNQLLVEMDGFDTSEGIIVIAATNRPDILDPALLRPGRFDRQIFIPRPDVRGRYEILKVHAKDKKLSPNVDLELVARATPGFTGADLENVLNEAALLAARKGKDYIEMEDIEEAIDRVTMGLERKGMVISPKEKEKIAYHEAGHAIMSLMVPGSDALHKVSIIPRGMALGVTQQLPIDDKHMYDKEDLMGKILTLMGGRAAEEVFYGKEGITTGAENDLQRATELAYRMVSMWGMSERVGPLAVRKTVNPFLGGITTSVDISEDLRREIDQEVRNILLWAYEETKKTIETYKEPLKAVVKKLLEKETISCEEFVEVLKLYGVEIKNECKKEELNLEKKTQEEPLVRR
ncbi:ATP-dependent zinc metalloprotease FtsH [Hydrogenobacter hydrogenophilus]|uniref:ATP-dependent zinc metalloprotease FtsH n=1 Tax=Hydrogenobacter hydrogenophilus TaxID=35835 RepID=A0A285P502_9AQUI|nr:ATP-dependent zinc metalloprotease FtsH [Hydrogenobacter hydrogenophilus]SNZ14951.1 cell division protease FtsH [Hydrogenobacter hydrogenophilus]